MTINDPIAFAASQWDWGCLDGCFGETKIRPTDIDGWVERNGLFLCIETKLPGVEIPNGQMITFRAMSGTGWITVLIIWGHPQNPIKAKILHCGLETDYEHVDMEWFRNTVKRWFSYADNSTTKTR